MLRSRRSLAVVAGMKKTNDHAELIKVERQKKENWNTYLKHIKVPHIIHCKIFG